MRPVPEPAPRCTSGRGALMPPASLVGRCALLRRLHELLVAPADLLGVPVGDELALVHPQHASAHALNCGHGLADQDNGFWRLADLIHHSIAVVLVWSLSA